MTTRQLVIRALDDAIFFHKNAIAASVLVGGVDEILAEREKHGPWIAAYRHERNKMLSQGVQKEPRIGKVSHAIS